MDALQDEMKALPTDSFLLCLRFDFCNPGFGMMPTRAVEMIGPGGDLREAE